MPRFDYQADNAKGVPSEGTLEADSLADAAAQLEARGLTPRSLRFAVEQEAIAPPEPAAPAEAIGRLLAARHHLGPALAAYAAESPLDKRSRRLARQARVLSGDEDALRGEIAASPREWATLLSAAASDSPDGALAQAFGHDARARQNRRRWSLAAAYPLFLATLATLLLWAFSAFLAPGFRDIYDEFGLCLPALTHFVLAASAFLNGGGAILVIALGAITTLAVRCWPGWAPAGLRRWAEHRLGALSMTPTTASRVARETAALIESGASVEQALGSAAPPGSGALRPALAFALSERTHDELRPRVLRQLDLCYEEHAAKRASLRHALIGPVAIVVVGVIVGVTVLALYLPLVKLIEGLTG